MNEIETQENEKTIPLLNHLRIQNYKSLVDVELDLGRFNVLIGENGCGKSNILEALTLASLTFYSIFPIIEYEMLYQRLRIGNIDDLKSKFDKKYINSDIFIDIDAMKIEFKISQKDKTKILIGLSYFEKNEERDRVFSKYLTQPENLRDINYLMNFHKDWKLSLDSEFSLESIVNNYRHYQPTEHILRDVNSESGQLPLGERGERLFDALDALDEERMAELKDHLRLIGWFDDFEVNYRHGIKRDVRLKDKYFDEATPFLDFRHVNEGFLFILFYLVLFLHPQSPPFFGIDNLDTALNPKLAAKLTSLLTQLAKERQKQVIVTTHNPMLLDGLDLKDEEVRLFAVYRNASGHTTVRRIRPENNNIRLSEAWIRGYLGALPMI